MAMLEDVLNVCTSSAAPLDGVIAVVDTTEAELVARSYGAEPVADGGVDMNEAALSGLCAAKHHGADTVIVLPGDVPLLTVADLRTLIAESTAPRSVVIGASWDGTGTNALLLRPPDVIAPAFGPPSVDRHARLGQAAGASVQVLTRLGLALDIDTPADLATSADLPVGPRTATFLALSDLEAVTRI